MGGLVEGQKLIRKLNTAKLCFFMLKMGLRLSLEIMQALHDNFPTYLNPDSDEHILRVDA